ncbi:calcium-binding protein [Solirubrobacter soli]|uniref:calcium-binding protein n=1 Tax=Solirubrobacter soli TaxID=363832 RepID=UPI0004190FBA|nr:calcium-binding protein [Solirubrobacter soli]
MRLTSPLLATLAAVLLVPAAAQAATVTYEGDTLVYRADPGVRDFVNLSKDDGGMLLISGEENTTASAPCTVDYAVHCPMPARVRLELGDGDDSNGFSSDYPANLPVTVLGGDGKDQLQTYNANAATLDGGAGNDMLKGWDTNDTLLGGPGDDEIQASGGADHIEAGDGNDTISGETYHDPAPDYIDGGNGIDTVDDWSIPDKDYNPPIAVSMDGVANDGRPGEGDNVVNVEKIASHVSGTLSGGAGDDDLQVWANIDEGNSTLLGNGGNDKLTAGDYQDNLDGGPGNDVLNAGFGNDTITGGPGQDTIFADATSASCGYFSYTCKIPFGNDIVYAQDGEADTIDCGVGQDTAYVDAIDTVANCETVDKSGGGSPSGPAGAGGTGSTAGPQANVTGKLSIKTISKKGLAVTVPCAGACKVSVSLIVKSKTVASAKKTMLKAGDAKLTVKVSKTSLKAFKKLKKASATLKVTVEDASGKTSSSKSLSLKK